MRSQWKRSEKFDTGSRHFERILKARPHIRDVIPSELAQSSKAKALLFCSKFSCELKKFGPGCKTGTEKNRERGVTFLNLPKKNKKIAKEVVRTATSGWEICAKNTRKCVCVQRAFHRRLFQNSIPIWACGWKHKKEVIEKKCFPTIFQWKALVKAHIASERHIARNE